jgi:acetylornithine deacetylase/succinyl-diaminopimelate desuccinylase-like protein
MRVEKKGFDMVADAFSRRRLFAFAAVERRRFEDTLRRMVEIPSVSVEPAHRADVARVARFAADLIRRLGGTARLIPTGGHPLVHGVFHRDRSFPTVTLYNHLDVQPAEVADGWRTPPFRFTRRGDRYFARGTTDDKGPALTALWGATYALRHGAEVNFHVLWETEEEIGSPHFEATIAAHRRRLATDAVIVSDTVWVSRSRPACPAGLRGLQGFRFTLETGATDQHSGTTGGPARNPIAELAALIADCVDAKTGVVRIPGFYAHVVPPRRDEIAELKKSGFTRQGFQKDHLLTSLRVSDPLEMMKRLWCLPTFEVHGIAGGYQGPGVKTIVPPRATAIVSCRLVPDMTTSAVARLVTAWVRRRNPDVRVEVEAGMPPYRGRTKGPHPDAIRAALKFAFGKTPVFVREGGSIGAVVSMEKVLRAPVFFLGLSLPEHGYHAPNENYDWRQARGGMLAFAEYLRRCGEIGRRHGRRPRQRA